MPRNQNKDNQYALRANERQQQALVLRRRGKSLAVIAQTCGYKDPSGAYRAIRAALKKTLQEPADELRTMEVERLDVLLDGLWDKAEKGDTWSVDRVLKIMERRASLLGLDAPVKREETIHLTFQRLADQVASEHGLEPAELVAEAERILAQAVR